VLTRILIAINVIVFGWEQFAGPLATDPSLANHGALIGTHVLAGEWWRIVTAAFLHGSVMHILFNMFALFQVGQFVEAVYGTPRMAAIYFISMIGSGLLVTVIDPTEPTVGASGAIFGLFGALVVAGMRLGKPGRDLLRQSIGVIVLNLIIGFTVPNISNSGHIGGLIAGFLSGLVVFPPHRLPPPEPVYAPPVVDLRNDPGVVTIEQPVERPVEHDPQR
jgi:rhomboid protease GluP